MRLKAAQNQLDTFPRNFSEDGEVASLLPTDTTDFCPRQLLQTYCGLVLYVADLLATQRGSRQLVTDLL